jgi:hypothetical protein
MYITIKEMGDNESLQIMWVSISIKGIHGKKMKFAEVILSSQGKNRDGCQKCQ